MDIQTDDIAVFLAVVREGSFGRAASSLLVSQPAVSERIARLERATATSLFRRSARGATLTQAGEAFLPYAQRTVALLDDAVETVRSLDEAPRLRVAVHTTFAHRMVPLVLQSLATVRRSIKIRDAHSDAIIAMLMDGACDLGFVVAGARPRPLRFTSLPPDPVVPVVSPSDALVNRILAFTDLIGHRVAFNRFGDGAEQFVGRLRAAEVPEWDWTECSDAVTALHLAAFHAHVAFVPQSLAEVHQKAGTVEFLRLRPRVHWNMPLTMACRASDAGDPAIAAVRAGIGRLLSRPRSKR
jgi:DNA-binding transcriptional LysR family regulator